MDKLICLRSFVRVVEAGSFSAVAGEENTNQGTISKRIASLESELGARLLVRGKKRHTLTDAGRVYYERSVKILEDVDKADSEARSLVATPTGKIRVTIPTMFGGMYVAPFVPEFLATYPEIDLDLTFSEKMVNFVEEGIDVAVRLGHLKDSSLIAKKFGYDRLVVVTSKEYLQIHGTPKAPTDLKNHNCLIYSLGANSTTWNFSGDVEPSSVNVEGNFKCDTGTGLIPMLLNGTGIAYMPSWLVTSYIESGELVQILNNCYHDYPISAVYSHRQYTPMRVKVFIEFIESIFKANPSLNLASPALKKRNLL